ncbi:hypothetical protein P5673_025128 [Acropora cervicornis]|uniref:Uncharacterized protein n=1 Tax=Acropora cervicornis TaxID=6130 RepID=A0AAD9Q2N9_ACRCE|nr:hypothetical protein P5673_025128 [Acropora cervicornis]
MYQVMSRNCKYLEEKMRWKIVAVILVKYIENSSIPKSKMADQDGRLVCNLPRGINNSDVGKWTLQQFMICQRLLLQNSNTEILKTSEKKDIIC